MLGFGLGAALFVGLVLALSNYVRPSEVQQIMEKLPPMFRGFPLAAGLRGISGGIDDGSLEVVLAQPVSRTTYYAALAAVLGVGVTVVLGCCTVSSLLVRALVDLPGDLPTSTLLQLSVSGWALALAVGGIALWASAVGAGGGRPGTWAIGSVVAMMFMRFLADMVPDLEWLRWGSIFGYHAPREVVRDGLTLPLTLALVALALTCAAAGLVSFRRKELTF
jgi:ABC-2 type transport system permease protein